MAVIRVPRTPKSSFNKDRPPSALLKDQIKHLEWAVLPALQRNPEQLRKIKQVKTESHAAERIAQLTRMVLEAQAAPAAAGAPPRVELPPLPKASRRPKRKRPATSAARRAKPKSRTAKRGAGAKKGAAARKRKRR